MNILGVKVMGHDPGAAVIASDGRIVAISEERLNRIKHSFEIFPEKSIPYCLNALELKPADIGLIVLEQVGRKWIVDIKKIFLEHVSNQFPNARIEIINHHDAHAASAFFCSPFKEAAILIYDGAGEVYKTYLGVAGIESETLYRGEGARIYEIQKTLHLRQGKSNPYTQGIGKLYSDITYYVGMGKYEEGKTMGLAPYGTDAVLSQIPMERWVNEANGHVICNTQISYPPRPMAARIGGRKGIGDAWRVLRGFVRMRLRRWVRPLFFMLGGLYSKDMFSEPAVFPAIRLPRPPRNPKTDALPDDYYASVAWAAQKVLEEFSARLGRKLKEATGSENLCVAGGVGLNIDANKNFLDRAGFKKIFIQPASSDTGIPLGCALWGKHVILGEARQWEMMSASLGRKYTDEEITAAIEARAADIIVKKSANVAEETARLLADGNIVGWFYGGSEYGPRALGNRSILADARKPDMKDVLNKKVKHRESWRPFAASILREDQRRWFELDHESPFMLLAASVAADKRGSIPSVTHVDGTSRIQSVTKEANGRYYDLIAAFKNITGVPLILNTSFNDAGEPIVETPAEALHCFLNTKMDFLALEEYIIAKKQRAA